MDEFKGGILSTEALKQKALWFGLSSDNQNRKTVQFLQAFAASIPTFKMPQVWKSSIAVDYTVPVSFPIERDELANL